MVTTWQCSLAIPPISPTCLALITLLLISCTFWPPRSRLADITQRVTRVLPQMTARVGRITFPQIDFYISGNSLGYPTAMEMWQFYLWCFLLNISSIAATSPMNSGGRDQTELFVISGNYNVRVLIYSLSIRPWCPWCPDQVLVATLRN
jgi:hypothetical protein